MRKLLYVFYPICWWWDNFCYFSHLNSQFVLGKSEDYEPYDFSNDTLPKLLKRIHGEEAEEPMCEQGHSQRIENTFIDAEGAVQCRLCFRRRQL